MTHMSNADRLVVLGNKLKRLEKQISAIPHWCSRLASLTAEREIVQRDIRALKRQMEPTS